MEMDVSDSSSPFSVEDDNLLLDPDLNDADSYDIPDPGMLQEKNEPSFSKSVSQLFTRRSWWQNLTPRARARQLWLLLRISLHSFVEKEKRSELQVAHLTHGLEPLRRLEVAAGLCWVTQDPVGRRLVVLDGAGCLHLHREDGWPHEKLLAPIALTGLVTVLGPMGSVGRFVGWGPAGLAILKPDFSLLWLSEPGVGRSSHREPICCLPVPDLGLLLVAEAGGGLALWKFRVGGRRLVPCGSTLQPLLSAGGGLVRLALGPLPPNHSLCCFAAYGSAVFTFDLHTWAVIDERRDLHKTTISDLAYCGEVEAIVTASRDSTVKVWEADWQIRMVFVGHTGPVTALSVLPNTSLVLSASQDGTLRTWDLQAVAQVGKVALNCWGQDVRSGCVNRLLAPASPGWPVLSLRAGSVELWRLRELYSPLAQLSAPVLHLQVAPELPLPLHPPLPVRLVCACSDGSVYLVSLATGRTVSALLLEPEDCAAAVAYCLPRETLWLLTRAGHLICANAARCPMCVLGRVCPLPPPAPRPCCLHLYSHLTDPSGAFASWEIVRQREGKLCHSDTRAWKDKNRYLPVVGHTDGMLSVLNWHTLKPVFYAKAHSPGPVTAIASTSNSIVSSGGDLTVKMWHVFPYAEESLSLLRTFSCCHPALVLCALGERVMVAFEDPNSATYGLVQFSLGNSRRYDHQPQDDHMEHITGLCCCPALKLYASSSLDCTIRIWTAENRLLRLLQLNGAPQALTFCSNSGDLVLALGSRLCLVSHRLYLPTSYLVKKLCQNVPDVVDDPPLPLTSEESLTSAQLQRLANLHGVASLSMALSFIHRQTAEPQQPLLEEDLEALVARNQDLQQLRLGQVVPAARPPLSWKRQQQAFDNYLCLIYGPGMHSRSESQRWNTMTLTVEKKTWGVRTTPKAAPSLGKAEVCIEVPKEPTALPPQDWGALGQRFSCPSRVTLPTMPTHQWVHSKASQLLARSSLSSFLGLSVNLQLQLERLHQERPVALDPSPSHLQHRIPLLLERQPKEFPSNIGGFFPATIQPYKDMPRPIHFPGWVPNSMVLQQMWQHREVSKPGALAQLTSQRSLKARGGAGGSPCLQVWGWALWRGGSMKWPLALSHPQPGGSQDDLWLLRGRRYPKWQQRSIQSLGKGDDDHQEELDLDWDSDFLSPHLELSQEQLGSDELSVQVGSSESLIWRSSHDNAARRETYLYRHRYHTGHSLWEERYGHLPRFLRFFVIQNWFKKLFPIFTLEVWRMPGKQAGGGVAGRQGLSSWSPQAYPEVSTVDGLASLFMDLLEEASWVDRVHILHAFLRLLPDMSQNLCRRLHGILLHLLNLEQPPSLQDWIQKQFVLVAFQILLACSLESRDVVLELMSYFLYSPPSCRPELKKLLDALGLQDPEGFLFKEMTTWVQDLGLDSKAALRSCCAQKLEEMIRHLQTQTLQPSVAKLSEVLPKVSDTSVFSSLSEETLSQISMFSRAPTHISVTSSLQSWSPSLVSSPEEAAEESQILQWLSQMHVWHAHRTHSETVTSFSSKPDVHLRSSAPDVFSDHPLPLEQTEWSQSKVLDLGSVDALNYFCGQQRAQQPSSLQKEAEGPCPRPQAVVPNAVLPQPHRHLPSPILRLQETKIQRSPVRQRGEWGQGWRWILSFTPAWVPQGLHLSRGLTAPLASGQMLFQRWEGRTLDGPIRMLKLPLPRVEVRPFPLDWPRPARPLPPLLLQPALQRYFLPDYADPDNYS
ncbi:WD repeat-containing protein 97 [Molossus molossus]|uniref:WD repeat-containing protein 97 n=1 Tax=Molossus molossus TaxID=27622 RepID=UPI0017464433|nr:WD repeat-containing protein 97 [Molossus molossus]